MTLWDDIEKAIADAASLPPAKAADALLEAGENVLVNWLQAHDRAPNGEEKEGFRLLALHRQGSTGIPSFNACRETCRELAYHHNLIVANPDHPEAPRRQMMMGMVATHLLLFVRGKMDVAGLGEFCCSSRPIRTAETVLSDVPTRS